MHAELGSLFLKAKGGIVSPLMKRLQALLEVERDPYRRAEVFAKIAAHHARTGNFQAARDIIFEVRQNFGDGRSGRVTILLMLAEALVLHYGDLAISAADRVARAVLLAKAVRDRELIALTSAWMAYFQFEKSDFEQSLRSIAEAIDNSTEVDHAALSRCSIVLLNEFALCGDSVASQRWFLKGREHALAEGDQAGVEALLHSKAVFGVAWLRVERCKAELDEAVLTRARQEIASARNLQVLTQVGALKDYIEIADVSLSLLEGMFEQALVKLNNLDARGPFPVRHFNSSVRAIEQAYSHAGLGQIAEAIRALQGLDLTEIANLDVDDLLVAAWMMNELATKDPRLGDEVSTQARLQSARSAHRQAVTSLQASLVKFKTV